MKKLLFCLLLTGCSAAVQIGPNPKPDISKEEVLSYFKQMDERVQMMIARSLEAAAKTPSPTPVRKPTARKEY